MLKQFLFLSLTLVVALMAGCASTPKSASKVENLRDQYNSLANTSGVDEYAPLALREAEESLTKAEKLVKDNADNSQIAHQAYLAEKKISVARETLDMKKAESTVANAELQRKDVLLDARTREAKQANAAATAMAARAHAAEEYALQMESRASSLETEVENLTTEKTERGLVLTLGNILFEVNKASLKSGSERTLEKVASFLNEYPDRKIMVEGFTDSTGSESYNEQLSQERAMAVKNTLIEYGVTGNRVLTRGYGEEYPVASNDSNAGRQQNRRVEIIVANNSNENIDERS